MHCQKLPSCKQFVASAFHPQGRFEMSLDVAEKSKKSVGSKEHLSCVYQYSAPSGVYFRFSCLLTDSEERRHHRGHQCDAAVLTGMVDLVFQQQAIRISSGMSSWYG